MKEFEAEHRAKGNSNNTISAYLRGLSAVYNSAIKEDKFEPEKNPFHFYKIPSSKRTKKKKALPKENFTTIRKLNYPVGSNLFHVKKLFVEYVQLSGDEFD